MMGQGAWGSGDDGRLVAVFAAVLAIAPFASVPLPFRASLYLQAALAVALTGCLLGLLWRRPRNAWRRARSVSGMMWVGVALYGGTAILGLLVAVAAGRDLKRAAGQFLAMGLLAAAAVGAFALRGNRAWSNLSLGLTMGAAAGASIDLLHWAWSLLRGNPLLRLTFANAVNASSVSLMALPFALALAFHRPSRFVGWALTPLLLLDIIGSGVRSLWLVTIAVILLLLIGRFGWNWLLSRRALGWAGVLIVALAVLGLALISAGKTARPVPGGTGKAASIFAPSSALGAAGETRGVVRFAWPRGGSPSPAAFSAPFGIRAGRAFDLTACVLPGAEGRAAIEILWLGEGRRILGMNRLELERRSPTGCVSRSLTSPLGATAARLVFRGGSLSGLWRLHSIALDDAGPAWIAPLTRQLGFEMSRARSLVEFLHHPSKIDEGTVTIRFRLQESLAVLRQFRSSSLVEKVFGHGLGALLPLHLYGFDNRGHWIHYSEVNFIHNFYFFLLFKVGILGLIAVCAALLCWMTYLYLLLRRGLSEPVRSFVLASLIAWLGFAVWSLAAPEILDFRLAPLWGLMLGVAAASSRATRLSDGAQGASASDP
ncbi:MAG TPA: hypothetical protein VKA53_07360 [Thermoanaerobaculia bacterium]|nr:hypothetical protein [Thermoanaerobaculia bacterium]